jgi:hypothetical protein
VCGLVCSANDDHVLPHDQASFVAQGRVGDIGFYAPSNRIYGAEIPRVLKVLVLHAISSTNATHSELSAQTLTFSDLQNQMQHSTSSGGISGGYGGRAENWKPTTEGALRMRGRRSEWLMTKS